MTAREEVTLTAYHEIANAIGDLEAVESLMSLDRIGLEEIKDTLLKNSRRLRGALNALKEIGKNEDTNCRGQQDITSESSSNVPTVRA
jgi:hypothetical protein